MGDRADINPSEKALHLMKVLHVIPAVAAQYGGPSQVIFEMCRALHAEGAETLVATTDADGKGRLAVELKRPVSYRGVRCIFFPRQWSETFKYAPTLVQWLDRNVMHFKAVHIHSVFSYPCLAAARACRCWGVPYIVRPLGTLDPWSLRQKRFRKWVLWHAAAKQMLSGAKAVHYTTAEECRLAERALGLRRGVVIPLGVDREQLQNREAMGILRQLFPSLGEDPYILVLCRLHPKKGLELLLEAFLSLIKQPKFKEWQLVVAGDGEPKYVASLRRIVMEDRGSDRVLFTGWLEGDAKISALREAALLALPSYQENFGISVMEALGCGVPVLISPHVNLAEEIQAAGAGWVVSLEPRALEQALVKVLLDVDERRRRGERGREFASRFKWPQIATQLVQLYRFVAEGHPVGPLGVPDGDDLQQQKDDSGERSFPEKRRAPLSVVILTYNEEVNLPACLESIKGLDCEIFVVDSGSSDRTVEIATAAGAQVVAHPFDNYALQRNWAQENLPIQTEWILHVDADERLTPALVAEVNQVLREPPANVDGFLLSKRTIFMGRWIKHGGHYPSFHLRLFRRDRGRCEDRLYDQHFVVHGRVKKLKSDYIDMIMADLDTWLLRHTRWADLDAKDILTRSNQGIRVQPRLFGGPIERRRWFKDCLYLRSPPFLRVFLLWFYRYFFRLGFLDGKEGFIFHFLQAFWFRTLVDIKLDEMRRYPDGRLSTAP